MALILEVIGGAAFLVCLALVNPLLVGAALGAVLFFVGFMMEGDE